MHMLDSLFLNSAGSMVKCNYEDMQYNEIIKMMILYFNIYQNLEDLYSYENYNS